MYVYIGTSSGFRKWNDYYCDHIKVQSTLSAAARGGEAWRWNGHTLHLRYHVVGCSVCVQGDKLAPSTAGWSLDD